MFQTEYLGFIRDNEEFLLNLSEANNALIQHHLLAQIKSTTCQLYQTFKFKVCSPSDLVQT